MANVNSEIKNKLIEVYNTLSKTSIPEKGDGWVNLTLFRGALKVEGIDYKGLGFEKLVEFVNSTFLFIKHKDTSKPVPVIYLKLKEKKTKRDINPTTSAKASFSSNTKISTKETEMLLHEWNLSAPIAVGFFQQSSDGSYSISDIRSESFRELRYPESENSGNDDITQDLVITDNRAISNTYKSNKYYKFEWTTEPTEDERGYKIVLARPIRLMNIKPEELIHTLHDIWNNPDAAEQMKNVMNMVSAELMASSDGTFIYELLQNANDNAVVNVYGASEPVDVEFHITENYLICRHSGDYFSPRDIAGVCKLGDGSKKFRKNAIGYKGIGFKTVFHSHDWVFIQSNEYSFHFSESRNRPWQIMPIWQVPESLDQEVKDVLSNDRDKFRVVTIMKPRDKALLREIKDKNYKYLLSDIFKDVRDIIFIPNINSVRIFDNGTQIVSCQYDESSSWIRSSLTSYDLSEIQEDINKEIILHKERGIPGKYTNFGDTTVAFACKCEGKKLRPVKNATVNCYLPTKAEFGFPFLMNTDMVPTGPRDQLKLDIEFNAKFAYIAGIKFVEWIQTLLNEGYETSSVFDLIPDFDECKNGAGKYYSNFVSQFELGFYNKCKDAEIIPTVAADGTKKLSKISEVICDLTGLTGSGIMPDAVFYQVSGMNALLPTFEIRSNKKLYSLFAKLGVTYSFDKTKLIALCSNAAFLTWLKIQKNNDSWIKFIVTYKHVKLFSDKSIFLNGKNGTLSSSEKLLYNPVAIRKELSCFVSKYIDYLSVDTVKLLAADENALYNELKSNGFNWGSFYPATFAESILNCKEDIDLLKVEENSVGFYHMMARTYDRCFSAKTSLCKKFPLFVDGGTIDAIEGNRVYFDSKDGKTFKTKTWIDNSWLYFMSSKYFEEDKEVMETFFKRFVSNFTMTGFLSNIVLSDKNATFINQKVSESYSNSIDFVKFLFTNRTNDAIKDSSLQVFALHVIKVDGTPTTAIPKENYIYNPCTAFDEFVKHPWVGGEWLYSLKDTYYKDLNLGGEDSSKNVGEFFEKKFKVRISQKAKFCTEIAMAKLPDILKSIKAEKNSAGEVISTLDRIEKAKNSNVDFFVYLSENYTTIFEGSSNYFNKNSFPFLNEKGEFTDGPLSYKKFYSNSDEAEDIKNATWLPCGYVDVVSSLYKSKIEDFQLYKSLVKKLGVSDFDYNALLTDVVLLNKISVTKEISTFEKNKAFHKFFKTHSEKIVPDNLKRLSEFPVFLVGENDSILSSVSKGHNLADTNLQSLVTEGIITATSANLIHNDYFDSSELDQKYWGTSLLNTVVTNQTILDLLTGTQKSNVSQYIQKSNDNCLKFWRLLNSFSDISKCDLKTLKMFPILMKKGTSSDSTYVQHILLDSEECYISDNYFANGGSIEYLVSEYAKDAWLLSPEYIESNSQESIQSWFSFWEKLGILSSNEDIILHTIIPHLDSKSNVNEKTPVLLFNNKKLIESKMDATMKEHFKKLHLKTKNGLTIISEVYFIQKDEAVPFEEPMPEFPLTNELSSEYTPEQVSFFRSLTNLELKTITSAAAWFLPKINQYVNVQNIALGNFEESQQYLNILPTLHLIFIKNLAKFRTSYTFNLLQPEESILNKIKLVRAYDKTFVDAKTLTLGSVYKPYCDFQAHGVSQLQHVQIQSEDQKNENLGLDYISEDYFGIKDIVSLFNAMGVHHKFIRRDLKFLKGHDFCLYFWTNYVLDKDRWKEINEYIDEGIFRGVECVPTANSVKKSDELYSRDLIDFVKRLVGGEDMIPMDIKKEIQGPDGIIYPNPLYKFAFLDKLTKAHCYEFLLNSVNVENKKTILRRLLEYKDKGQITTSDIEDYRKPDKNALWMNGQNKPTHITKLYAIGKDDSDSMYNIYLGADDLVISSSNIPDNRFEEICSDILGMTVLHAKDGVFETIPKAPKTVETDRIVSELKQKALLLATILSEDGNWEELYKSYQEKISALNFVKCQSISIVYKNDTRLHGEDVATVHFDSATSTFYYVNDWQDKFVFDQLLDFLIKEIGIASSQILMIKRILDTNRKGYGIDEYVDKFCKKYYTNSKFVEALVACYPQTAKNLHLTEAIHTEDTDDFIDKSPAYDSVMKPVNSEISNNDDNKEQTGQQNSSSSLKDTGKITNENSKEVEKNTENSTEGRESTTQTEDESSQSHTPKTGYHEKEHSEKPEPAYTGSSDNNNEQEEMSGEDEDSDPFDYDSTPEQEYNFEGSVDEDRDYEPLGSTPHSPRRRNSTPWHSTREEAERMRSNGTPLELESLEPTDKELDILAQCGISPEQISDTNYLAQLRLYSHLCEDWNEEPEESIEEFIKNADDVSTHKLKNGRYIHACSAARGVMYISPSVWNKMMDDKWSICVYLDGKGKNFHRIDSVEEFLKLVVKDDVVLKITGKEKVDVVNTLYSNLLKDTKGTAYTLIRVASRTNMDAVFAHYVGAMAEPEDGNEDTNEYGD